MGGEGVGGKGKRMEGKEREGKGEDELEGNKTRKEEIL